MTQSRNLKNFILLILGGLVAGFSNGLLGAGGGVIAVFVLSYACADILEDRRDVFSNAIAVMLPISVVSSVLYAISGKATAQGFSLFIIPAVLGGIFGGFLLRKTNPYLLKKIFAVIVIISGAMMIFRG